MGSFYVRLRWQTTRMGRCARMHSSASIRLKSKHPSGGYEIDRFVDAKVFIHFFSIASSTRGMNIFGPRWALSWLIVCLSRSNERAKKWIPFTSERVCVRFLSIFSWEFLHRLSRARGDVNCLIDGEGKQNASYEMPIFHLVSIRWKSP